jgi:heme A synthase
MDRFVGNTLSLITVGLLIAAWIKTRPRQRM